MPYCECGCGDSAQEGNRFLWGHNSKLMNNPAWFKKGEGSHYPIPLESRIRAAQAGAAAAWGRPDSRAKLLAARKEPRLYRRGLKSTWSEAAKEAFRAAAAARRQERRARKKAQRNINISLAHRRKVQANNAYREHLRRSAAHARSFVRKDYTSIEHILYRLLRQAEFTYISQYCLEPYVVDAFLPDYNLAFEADGKYWHRNLQTHDAARDAYLFRRYGVTVVGLSEDELEEVGRLMPYF